MRAAKIYLVLMGLMSVVFGVLYLVSPATFTDPMGFGILAPSALTDVRATYGGLQIGMGIFMFWCCMGTGRLYTGMFFALVSVASIAICRAIGLVIDGDAIDVLKMTLAFEAVLGVVSLVLFLRTPKTA